MREGQLTATSCSQQPAVSSIFYAVITQTSLFSSQVSKLPGHTEFWKHYYMGIFHLMLHSGSDFLLATVHVVQT